MGELCRYKIQTYFHPKNNFKEFTYSTITTSKYGGSQRTYTASVSSVIYLTLTYNSAFSDLYSGLLVEPLGDDLLAKGWGRLHNPLPSNCSVKHNVYNVKSVKLPLIPPFNITSDHSKWCVTMGKKTGIWTCIADMNREISQMRRGGGAVCTSNTAVWKTFSKMVDRYEKCP